jgi:hypothetical protein
MTSHEVSFDDIFKGAEEVEILGKLPAFLWAYIDNARRLVQDLDAPPDDHSESVRKVEKVLDILNSAQTTTNKDLKDRLGPRLQCSRQPKRGLPDRQLVDSFTPAHEAGGDYWTTADVSRELPGQSTGLG